MKNKVRLAIVIFVSALTPLVFVGCVTTGDTSANIPTTPVTYGYTPIDPVPIPKEISADIFPLLSTNGGSYDTNILDYFPDEAMRLATSQGNASGEISYGPATIAASGSNYTVVLDYIKVATRPWPVRVVYTNVVEQGHDPAIVAEIHALTMPTVKTESGRITTNYIPIYAGVGIRLMASFYVKNGGFDLGNLVLIGAKADAQEVSGQLSIQLMGISGSEITAALPIPTDISSATIENALVAMGTIKSKIYDPTTHITPQIVGIDNLLGVNISQINGYISDLLGTVDDESISSTGANVPPASSHK